MKFPTKVLIPEELEEKLRLTSATAPSEERQKKRTFLSMLRLFGHFLRTSPHSLSLLTEHQKRVRQKAIATAMLDRFSETFRDEEERRMVTATALLMVRRYGVAEQAILRNVRRDRQLVRRFMAKYAEDHGTT